MELCEREYERNRRLNKRNEEQHAEIRRLRELIESANDGDPRSWARQKVLMISNQSQRKTIQHMAKRIAELGGGNHPVEHYSEELPGA